MGKINETRLKADLKAGKLARVYFLYGKEDYLVRFFANKIAELAVPPEARDMNLVRYSGAPKADELSDQLENMPFFSEYKCVLIKDFDAAAMADSELKLYLSLMDNIPETSILIISQENIDINPLKPGAKMGKLIEAADRAGVSCEMKYLTPLKTAQRAQREAAGAGCSLSPENAAYLARECAYSLTELDNELAKLCAYKKGGEITSEDIEKLVPKRIETNIYKLAGEIFAGRTGSALRILNDLFAQRVDASKIMAAISGHFTDLYRAKLGRLAGKSSYDVIRAFKYPPYRSTAIDGICRSVGGLSERYLGGCLAVLYRANKLLNSSKADKRQLIERAIIEIAALDR